MGSAVGFVGCCLPLAVFVGPWRVGFSMFAALCWAT